MKIEITEHHTLTLQEIKRRADALINEHSGHIQAYQWYSPTVLVLQGKHFVANVVVDTQRVYILIHLTTTIAKAFSGLIRDRVKTELKELLCSTPQQRM